MKAKLINMAKAWAGSLEYSLSPWHYAADELVVLCMHSTPKSHIDAFDSIVKFLLQHFKPLAPEELADYFEGKLSAGPYVLFTFDDGLKNNLYAAQVLNAHGLKALFFVVPDFIEASDQTAYYRAHVRKTIDSSFDKEEEDFTALSIPELQVLMSQGHRIGSHSMSHLLRASSDADMIEREVASSKKWLKEKLNTDVDSFCSPINTNFSISQSSKRSIEKNYTFHFTTFPGLHTEQKDPVLVYRRNIEVNWSLGKIKYALGKADLGRWNREIERYRQL
jgi:peptidoglycan/xylan/chitin deacetylase (PgdA/CDA1 family)